MLQGHALDIQWKARERTRPDLFRPCAHDEALEDCGKYLNAIFVTLRDDGFWLAAFGSNRFPFNMTRNVEEYGRRIRCLFRVERGDIVCWVTGDNFARDRFAIMEACMPDEGDRWVRP